MILFLFIITIPLFILTTDWSSNIETPTTWYSISSPYYITNDFTIQPSPGSLTIEPGVEIIFISGEIYVKGDVIANGNNDNWIIMKGTGNPFEENEGSGIEGWHFEEDYTPNVMFQYVYMSNFRKGVVFATSTPDSKMIFEDCRIEGNNIGVGSSSSSAPDVLIARRTMFVNNTVGSNAGTMTYENCEFKGNGKGVEAYDSSTVRNSIFIENGVAIEMKGQLSDTLIANNSLGVKGNQLIITNCAIVNNEIGIEMIGTETSNTNICGNRLWNVRTTDIQDTTFTGNYWGTTDQNLIRGVIYDSYWNADLGIVGINPILTTAYNGVDMLSYSCSAPDDKGFDISNPPSGMIFGNVVWNQDTIINSELVIAPTASLTVNPGVKLTFNDSGQIKVKGEFLAEGNAGSHIIMESISDGITGIILSEYNTPNVVLKFVEMYDFDSVIHYEQCFLGTSLLVEDSLFERNGDGVSSSSNSAPDTLIARRCIFKSNTRGSSAFDMTYEQCEFNSNSYGIACGYSGYASISDSIFIENGVGIDSGGQLTNSLVANNTLGIKSEQLSITNSAIVENDIGIDIGMSCSALNSNICGNRLWNIKNTEDENSDLKNNYWGTTNENLIRGYIQDAYWDTSYGIIEINPLLSTVYAGIDMLSYSCSAPLDKGFDVENPPSGAIMGNVTWSEDRNITSEIIVFTTAQLTITAGVKLTFSDEGRIILMGNFFAQGTSDNPIIMISKGDPFADEVDAIHGLVLSSSNKVSFIAKFVKMYHFASGIDVDDFSGWSTFLVEDSHFEGNNVGLSGHYYSGYCGIVRRCTFFNNSIGSTTSPIRFEQTSFISNTLLGYSTTDTMSINYFDECIFFDNEVGIKSSGYVTRSLILSNQIGYEDVVGGNPLEIHSSGIYDNDIGLKYYDGDDYISGNNICGNRIWNVEMQSFASASMIKNWWGVPDISYSRNTIVDGYLDNIAGNPALGLLELGKVKLKPYYIDFPNLPSISKYNISINHECVDVLCYSDESCSQNGICNERGICECFGGFSGQNCSICLYDSYYSSQDKEFCAIGCKTWGSDCESCMKQSNCMWCNDENTCVDSILGVDSIQNIAVNETQCQNYSVSCLDVPKVLDIKMHKSITFLELFFSEDTDKGGFESTQFDCIFLIDPISTQLFGSGQFCQFHTARILRVMLGRNFRVRPKIHRISILSNKIRDLKTESYYPNTTKIVQIPEIIEIPYAKLVLPRNHSCGDIVLDAMPSYSKSSGVLKALWECNGCSDAINQLLDDEEGELVVVIPEAMLETPHEYEFSVRIFNLLSISSKSPISKVKFLYDPIVGVTFEGQPQIEVSVDKARILNAKITLSKCGGGIIPDINVQWSWYPNISSLSNLTESTIEIKKDETYLILPPYSLDLNEVYYFNFMAESRSVGYDSNSAEIMVKPYLEPLILHIYGPDTVHYMDEEIVIQIIAKDKSFNGNGSVSNIFFLRCFQMLDETNENFYSENITEGGSAYNFTSKKEIIELNLKEFKNFAVGNYLFVIDWEANGRKARSIKQMKFVDEEVIPTYIRVLPRFENDIAVFKDRGCVVYNDLYLQAYPMNTSDVYTYEWKCDKIDLNDISFCPIGKDKGRLVVRKGAFNTSVIYTFTLIVNDGMKSGNASFFVEFEMNPRNTILDLQPVVGVASETIFRFTATETIEYKGYNKYRFGYSIQCDITYLTHFLDNNGYEGYLPPSNELLPFVEVMEMSGSTTTTFFHQFLAISIGTGKKYDQLIEDQLGSKTYLESLFLSLDNFEDIDEEEAQLILLENLKLILGNEILLNDMEMFQKEFQRFCKLFKSLSKDKSLKILQEIGIESLRLLLSKSSEFGLTDNSTNFEIFDMFIVTVQTNSSFNSSSEFDNFQEGLFHYEQGLAANLIDNMEPIQVDNSNGSIYISRERDFHNEYTFSLYNNSIKIPKDLYLDLSNETMLFDIKEENFVDIYSSVFHQDVSPWKCVMNCTYGSVSDTISVKLVNKRGTPFEVNNLDSSRTIDFEIVEKNPIPQNSQPECLFWDEEKLGWDVSCEIEEKGNNENGEKVYICKCKHLSTFTLGYKGSTCFGISEFKKDLVCSGNGKCTGKNTCDCVERGGLIRNTENCDADNSLEVAVTVVGVLLGVGTLIVILIIIIILLLLVVLKRRKKENLIDKNKVSPLPNKEVEEGIKTDEPHTQEQQTHELQEMKPEEVELKSDEQDV